MRPCSAPYGWTGTALVVCYFPGERRAAPAGRSKGAGWPSCGGRAVARAGSSLLAAPYGPQQHPRAGA